MIYWYTPAHQWLWWVYCFFPSNFLKYYSSESFSRFTPGTGPQSSQVPKVEDVAAKTPAKTGGHVRFFWRGGRYILCGSKGIYLVKMVKEDGWVFEAWCTWIRNTCLVISEVFFFVFFSRKTFRRRVLQKIVGVSDTTHIPHISSTPHISHTYLFQTYPTHIPHISSTPHISHTYPFQTYPTHIPHISSTPHISHTCPFQTYPTHIPHISSTPHISHTYPFQTYPTHIPHISSILHISIPNVSHTYPTHIQHTTHIHSKRIPPIPIQGLHEYEYHCMSFHTFLLGGNGNENRNLAFPPIVWRAYEHGIHR